jgi:hypothetical protein
VLVIPLLLARAVAAGLMGPDRPGIAPAAVLISLSIAGSSLVPALLVFFRIGTFTGHETSELKLSKPHARPVGGRKP